MSTVKVFVSYHFGHGEPFIARVCYFLRKQGTPTYFHEDSPIARGPGWRPEIVGQLEAADALLFFCGDEIGQVQRQELNKAVAEKKTVVLVELENCHAPSDIKDLANRAVFYECLQKEPKKDPALVCARKCCTYLGVTWIVEDGIPDGYPFDYEKAIIDAYLNDRVDTSLLSQGCPVEWPQVRRKSAALPNPVSEDDIGRFRDATNDHPDVFVAAISEFPPEDLSKRHMVFSLAGPRKNLHFGPRNERGAFKVGALVSGGIAPGTNAVVSAIFRRHHLYAQKGHYDVQVLGYADGFQGLLSAVPPRPLRRDTLEGTFNQGGSIIGTSRVPEFAEDNRQVRNAVLEQAVTRLTGHGIRVLYIIGGDGSMRAAHVLSKRLEAAASDISIVAVPKTMDNDVLWGWQTFGFESAVEKANEIIRQLHVEAESNPRLGVLQLFGSDSGYVVTHAALASGLCNLFLIPEVPFSMRTVWEFIAGQAERSAKDSCDHGYGPYRSHGLVLMAETAIPVDASWYLDWPDVVLTHDEKEEVYAYLRLKYWDQPPLEIPQDSVRKIRRYLGLDQDGGYDAVEPLGPHEKDYIREYARVLRTKGQTPDGLRSAGLKLVSHVLQRLFRTDVRRLPVDYWRDFRVFTNEPRHAIRAVSPTSSDILFGQRLGTLAVDGAMAGYTDFMISQWLTEYVMVPLDLVVMGRKRVPEKGIFYRSALASTGQPADLV